MKFSAEGWFSVNGLLVANGASDDKIYFTDIADSSVGGDTIDSDFDIDGDGESDFFPIPSRWNIVAYPGSNISMSNAELRDMGESFVLLGNPFTRQRHLFQMSSFQILILTLFPNTPTFLFPMLIGKRRRVVIQ